MNRNIAAKRRAFHDAIRHAQLSEFFTRVRSQMISNLERQGSFNMNEIMKNLPRSLVELNGIVPFGCQGQCEVIEYLVERVQEVLGRFKGLSLRQWASGMEILIKMLDYCQNIQAKHKIIEASQMCMVGMGFDKLEQNKILKHDILLLLLDYYITSFKWPAVSTFQAKPIKYMLYQLFSLNWSSKTVEYMKYVGFMNVLVDHCIQEKREDFLFEVFVSDTQLIVDLIGLVSQLIRKHSLSVYQLLICSILKILVNLTFALHQPKLNQIFMISHSTQLIIERLNSYDNTAKIYFLQLTYNLMVDQPSFRAVVKDRVDFNSIIQAGQFYRIYVEDLIQLIQS